MACFVTELGVWLPSEGWSSLLLEDGAAFDESSRAEAWGRGAVGCSGRKLSQGRSSSARYDSSTSSNGKRIGREFGST